MDDKNSKIADSIRQTREKRKSQDCKTYRFKIDTSMLLRTCCSSIVDIKMGWEPAALQSLLTTGRCDALWARVSS